MGHIISSEGIQACPTKIEAIKNIQEPTNTSQLKTFLGMVGYLSKFLPHLSTISEPLRVLEKKDTHWHWSHQQ